MLFRSNAPILLLVALYERRALWKPRRKRNALGPSKRSKLGFWNWSNFSVHADIQAVFEEEPPTEVLDRIEEEDDIEDAILENSFAGMGARSRSVSPRMVPRRRRLSSVWQD